MTHDEILHQIPDYVLGLLSPKQLGAIEQHVAYCTACRHALLRERRFGRLVRSTVDAATTPNNTRVRNLMPAIPQKRRLVPVLNGWQKQLVPVMLLLIMVAAGFTLNNLLPAGSVPSLVATAYAATATSTDAPTATRIQSVPQTEAVDRLPESTYSDSMDTAVLVTAFSAASPVETPDPLPTPAAAVTLIAAQ